MGLSRNKTAELIKLAMSCTLEHISEILAVIPATALAGKILKEVKKASDDFANKSKTLDEVKEDIDKIAKNSDDTVAFLKELKAELKQNCDEKTPKYVWWVTFYVEPGKKLSEEQIEEIKGLFWGGETDDEYLGKVMPVILEQYFCSDLEECEQQEDYQYFEPEYVTFNFDSLTDHPYDEDDLKIMLDVLNKIVKEPLFEDYIAGGGDDSCGYYEE